MADLVNEISRHFDYTLLLFLRVSGIIMPSPIFGRRNLPNIIKICFCLVLTYLFLSAFPFPERGVGASTLVEYFLICLKELFFGLTLGFILTVFFNLVYSAGQLMDMQIGFGIVSVFDIQNNSQVPVVGNLMNIFLLVMFYGVNGHLKVISILYSTIERIPIGRVQIDAALAGAIVEAFALSFVLAAMLAMPLIAAGVILETAMGVLIRAVPQINMFVIGIPIKLLVGLIVLAAMVAVLPSFSNKIYDEMFRSVLKAFGMFGVAG